MPGDYCLRKIHALDSKLSVLELSICFLGKFEVLSLLQNTFVVSAVNTFVVSATVTDTILGIRKIKFFMSVVASRYQK
jgi:hypothetical protein